MNTIRRILATSTLVLAAVGVASADTIIHHTGVLTAATTASGGPTPFNFGEGVGTEPDMPLVVSQFSCGTLLNCSLTSVHFVLNTTVVGAYSVTNTSGTSSTYLVNDSAVVSVADKQGQPPNFIFVQALPSQSKSITVNGGATATGSITATGSGSADYNCSGATCTVTNSTGGTVSSPINSALFIGAGTVTLHGIGAFLGSIGGNAFTGSVTGTGTANVSVVYDYSYDEVITGSPEPMTMALVGGGLLLVGAFRKRFKS